MNTSPRMSWHPSPLCWRILLQTLTGQASFVVLLWHVGLVDVNGGLVDVLVPQVAERLASGGAEQEEPPAVLALARDRRSRPRQAGVGHAVDVDSAIREHRRRPVAVLLATRIERGADLEEPCADEVGHLDLVPRPFGLC